MLMETLQANKTMVIKMK